MDWRRARQCHDGLVTGPALGQFRYKGVGACPADRTVSCSCPTQESKTFVSRARTTSLRSVVRPALGGGGSCARRDKNAIEMRPVVSRERGCTQDWMKDCA